MDHEVGDEAALKFAGAFYGSICFGKSIQTAFELGLNSLLLGSISEENTPKLISRTGVDPASIVLISNATSLASAALRERFDYRKRLLPSEFRRYGLLTGDAMLLPPELVRPTWFLRTNNWREGSQSETRIVSNGTSHRG